MRIAITVLLAGCGRLGFEQRADDVDASSASDVDNNVAGDAMDMACRDGNSTTFDSMPATWMTNASPGITVAVENGALTFTSASGTAQEQASVETPVASFTGHSVAVKVVSPFSHGETGVGVHTPGPVQYVHLMVSAGRVSANRRFATGTYQELVARPYEPANDVWLRITETGGRFVFETSRDRSDWTELVTADGFDVSSAFLDLSVHSGNGLPGSETARIEELDECAP